MELEFSPAELASLEARAKTEERSVSDVVRAAVSEYVDRHGRHDLLARAHNRDFGDLSGTDNT